MSRILTKLTIVLVLSLNCILVSSTVLADEDECRDPIAHWQTREVLKKRLEEQGWVVHHIRIDDGCYEVRAIDEQGRRVKATYAPASLTLVEFKVNNHEHEQREHREPEHQPY